MQEIFLRVSDSLLAAFWLWVLVKSLSSGRIGGRGAFQYNRQQRPGQYWFLIFIFALMVLHFGGLAWVGQTF